MKTGTIRITRNVIRAAIRAVNDRLCAWLGFTIVARMQGGTVAKHYSWSIIDAKE